MKPEPIEVVKRMLNEKGFDFDKPDPMTAWETCKEIVLARLHLAEINLLFRGGPFTCDCPKKTFCLEMCLFFGVYEEGMTSGGRVILHFQCRLPSGFKYPMGFVLRNDSPTLSSGDVSFFRHDDGLERFFSRVERLAEFQIALSLTHWACEISQFPIDGYG